MTRAYRDPTADQAVSHADKWERMQQALEAKHGVHRGDKLVVLDKRTSEGIKSNTSHEAGILIEIKVTVVALYPHCIHLHTEFGYDYSPTWWDFERRRKKEIGKHGQKKK